MLKRIFAGATLAALCCIGSAARADVFSPGPLSQDHAALEGLNNCSKCHEAGARVSEQRCLACHAGIKERIAKQQGLHGRLKDDERSCNLCHHDHQGRAFAMIDWGKGGEPGFDHRRTGFLIAGKHAQLRCEECHLDRLIADPEVRKFQATHPGRATLLGAAAECSACHFDEHRKQLRDSCADCHTERGWKPAERFDHARTGYPLQGKHAKVECLSCHAREPDPDFAQARASPTAPISETFSRFKPVAHEACLDCHKDPHASRFGDNCQSCHKVEGWLLLKGVTAERAFHEKTRYPLRGAHETVACKSCHGPFRGVKAVFKNLPFAQCSSCHVDAHLAQLGGAGSAAAACDRCHGVQGFRPPRYEAQDHTGWPLRGAHEAVACQSCHRADQKLAARAAPLRAWLEKRERKDEVSLVQFHPTRESSRCDACHADPHGGEFRKRVQKAGCSDCHVVASWKSVRFDHDRETKFALTGGHADRACASCHVADASGSVRYAPLDTSCASCHSDVHAGQFAPSRRAPTDCARCHSTADWKGTSFQHRPPFTTFELQGKHAPLACARCHRDVAVAAGAASTRYRGVPTSCEGCHVDAHRGAFQGFVP
jgi:hypothetical protein